MIDTVIFDLDGTLLYTLENLYKSTNYALKKCGLQKKTINEVRNFVGNGVKKLIERCVPEGEKNPLFEKCLSLFKEHYSATMCNDAHPYDGIVELLDRLNAEGIKCAVVSNKYDSAVKELCKKYFGSRITIAVGESDSVRKKPAPDSVLMVMKKLNTKNVVYVGDSEVDIQTAQNAKIPCISVTWGYKDIDFLIKNNARVIVENTAALYHEIKQISSQAPDTTKTHQE